MIVSIIGLGLIGGSMALDLKANHFCSKIIGVDSNSANAELALKLKLIDELSNIENAVKLSQLIIIATPVDAALNILSLVMMKIKNHQTIVDVGSTKVPITQIVWKNRHRGRFVATHPIWGTEFSGPKAAVEGKLKGNITVICNSDESDADALLIAEQMYDCIGMKRIYMRAGEHDLHAAYISHIAHITSFALALTVLKKEKKMNTIFELAGAGFESTVRLAKSNPETWVPIFSQNRLNILDVLNELGDQLNLIKKLLESEEYVKINKLILKANEIKKVLKK